MGKWPGCSDRAQRCCGVAATSFEVYLKGANMARGLGLADTISQPFTSRRWQAVDGLDRGEEELKACMARKSSQIMAGNRGIAPERSRLYSEFNNVMYGSGMPVCPNRLLAERKFKRFIAPAGGWENLRLLGHQL